MKISKRVFNFRLYVEGLKRLRVIGFGVLLLALTAAVLYPAVQLFGDVRYSWSPTVVHTVKGEHLCQMLAFFPLVAPIFTLVMFSYLFKRKESDFYHAIPFTRTCVYTTYTASVLTWVLGITVLSGTVAGLLWAVNPYTTFLLRDLVMWCLCSVLCSILLCGFMTVSISLSGNLVTTLLNFFAFTVLPYMAIVLVGLLLNFNYDRTLMYMGYNHDLVDLSHFGGGFFEINWCMPFLLFKLIMGNNIMDKEIETELYSTSACVSTAAMALMLFILGGVFYRIRRSETAGNSASSARTQHIFRCLFTLPFAWAALLAFLSNDEVVCVVLCIVTLLAYCIYELISTRQLKSLIKALPRFLYVLVGCLLLIVAAETTRQMILRWEIDADEIAEVEIATPYFYSDNVVFRERVIYNHQYQNYRSTDEALIKIVADDWKKTQEIMLDDRTASGGRRVTIRLKNGREIIRFTRGSEELQNYYLGIPEFKECLLAPPSDVTSIVYTYSSYERTFQYPRVEFKMKEREIGDADLIAEFMECFITEYVAMSDEDKYQLQDEDTRLLKNEQKGICVSYWASTPQGRMSICVLSEKMPETYAWLESYFLSPENIIKP